MKSHINAFDKITQEVLQTLIMYFTWPLMWMYIYHMFSSKEEDVLRVVVNFKSVYMSLNSPKKYWMNFLRTVFEALLGLYIIKGLGLTFIGLNFIFMVITAFVLINMVIYSVKRHRILFL